VRALARFDVERAEPVAGGADEAVHGVPEILEVAVAGGHVQLRGLDLAQR
jgi:hypothetical protein